MAKEMKNWLVNTIHDRELRRCAGLYLKGRMIDIGCAAKPYESMLKGYVSEHVGLDHEGTLHGKEKIDLCGTAYSIPADEESFDSVLCTAVIEHLENPARALKEAFRVLKRGGYAVYSAPLFWHIHEAPRDFYRFTENGLRYLFNAAGFEMIEIKPLSGFCVTFAQELIYFLYRCRRGGIINPLWWLVPPLSFLVQALAFAANTIDGSKEFTWMYMVTVKKP